MLDKDHPPLDRRLAELARRQYGVVSGGQLVDLGLSRQAIAQRVQAGRLHRLHRAVYAVGHRSLTSNARWLAAVLAGGEGAVLSHTHALALWQMRTRPSGPVNVTVARGRGRRSSGQIRFHCVRHLESEDTCTLDAIPATTVARTLLDVAEVVSSQALRHAVEAAERRELFDLREIDAVLERNPGRRGVKALRDVLAVVDDAPWTQSEFEREMLSLIRAAHLPEPQCNIFVEGELVDFYWPRVGLVVEADSYEFHRTRTAFESDRRRDAKLLTAGKRVLRLTKRRMRREANSVAADLRTLTL